MRQFSQFGVGDHTACGGQFTGQGVVVHRVETGAGARSMLGAVQANPDEEAELRSLAQRYGLPVDGVRFTLPETRTRARFDAVDYDTLARELPPQAV